MSRIGKKPITIPEGVEVKLDGNKISVKGPKGTDVDTIAIPKPFNTLGKSSFEEYILSPGLLILFIPSITLFRTLINNMIIGVKDEFKKELEINGVGYRVTKQGNNLNLTLGYSHPVIFEAPAGITFDVPNANQIIVRGIDKELATFFIFFSIALLAISAPTSFAASILLCFSLISLSNVEAETKVTPFVSSTI